MIRLADRHVVLEKGHVVWTGSSDQLAADPSVRERWLQV
jgi:branched-chain amino acid transport system ATP-binding protein